MKQNRKATDYLAIGDLVMVPDHITAPIIYTEDCENGKTVRVGKVAEKLNRGGVAVDFGGKVWDYSNIESLQFHRVH